MRRLPGGSFSSRAFFIGKAAGDELARAMNLPADHDNAITALKT
jgi:hypothetical protein